MPAAYAAIAVDASFATWGEPAPTTYTPPGGGAAVPCTVILDRREAGARPEDGRPPTGQVTIEVRKSEVANPAAGGTFAVGAEVFTVMSRPIAQDASGLVWTMWATK